MKYRDVDAYRVYGVWNKKRYISFTKPFESFYVAGKLHWTELNYEKMKTIIFLSLHYLISNSLGTLNNIAPLSNLTFGKLINQRGSNQISI